MDNFNNIFFYYFIINLIICKNFIKIKMKNINEKNYTFKPKNKHSKSINFNNNFIDNNYDDMITKIIKNKYNKVENKIDQTISE